MPDRAFLLAAVLVGGTALAAPLPYGDPTLPTPLNRPAPVVAPGAAPVEPEAPRWRISAVLIAETRRTAVINGRSVTPGARIDGARVLAVDAGGAWIEQGGRRIRLELPPRTSAGITAKTPTEK